jgi:serine/threonine-protein kinase
MRTALVLAIILVFATIGVVIYRDVSQTNGFPVPNVIGQAVPAAISTLTLDGLRVGRVVQVVSPYAPGVVVTVMPGAGAVVAPGSNVTIGVSRGPSVIVSMPAVTGMQLSMAERLLTSLVINFRTISVASWASPVIPGTVLAQAPSPTDQGHTGMTATLTVLAKGGTYPLPDVTGMTPIAAVGLLGMYGLAFGTTTTSCSSPVARGNVSSTQPTSGALVTSGTIVNLRVSSGQC